jgi:rhomboid family GlyGly-CTERM serine protease
MHTLEHRRTMNKGCPPMAGILLACGVVVAAVVVQSVAGLAEALQWQRSAGAGLSCLTSHLSHWSWNHLAWDLFAFGLLSLLCLRLMPSRYAFCLLVAAVLIPLEIQINQPLLQSYRGLSGIDCALFGLVVAALWRQSSGDRKRGAAQALAVLGGCSFLAKTMYELTTGRTVFVEPGQEPFVPVISAHLVGFLSGMVVGLLKPALEGFDRLLLKPSVTDTHPMHSH